MAGREVSVGLAQLWARFDWVRPICALVSIVSLARAGESWLVNGRYGAEGAENLEWQRMRPRS